MNPITRRARAAGQIRNHPAVLPTRAARDIDEIDVCDVHLARILRTRGLVDVEITLVKHDGRIRVLDDDILVRHVVDVAIPDIRPRPGLQTRAVLAVE